MFVLDGGNDDNISDMLVSTGDDLSERKRLLLDNADAVIVLPVSLQRSYLLCMFTTDNVLMIIAIIINLLFLFMCREELVHLMNYGKLFQQSHWSSEVWHLYQYVC